MALFIWENLMGRYGTREEVATSADYLALPQSGFITGVTLPSMTG